MHVPLTRFLRHMDLLESRCRLVPLADILRGPRPSTGTTVAITFDDAYRGAVELGAAELCRRGIPTTVFVAPGLLGARCFWWDAMAGPDGLDPAVRQHVLDVDRGRASSVTCEDLPACFGCADEDQLRALAKTGNVTFGAHTWSHPNLTRLDSADLVGELSRPLDWLDSFAGTALSVLSYPYGLYNPKIEAAAARAGYAAGLRIDGGWCSSPGDRWRIPRFNIPAGLSEHGLLLRLVGVLAA